MYNLRVLCDTPEMRERSLLDLSDSYWPELMEIGEVSSFLARAKQSMLVTQNNS